MCRFAYFALLVEPGQAFEVKLLYEAKLLHEAHIKGMKEG
jgi:hypothetical protein